MIIWRWRSGEPTKMKNNLICRKHKVDTPKCITHNKFYLKLLQVGV